MATWSFDLNFSGTHQDITTLVDIPSIKRTTSLFSELKPNTNKCEFRLNWDATLYGRLVTSKEAVVTILKNGSAYFTGMLSPNYNATVRDGRKFIELIAEDYNLSKLGATIQTVLAMAGYAVCTPASPSTSIVHVLATAAGVTLSSPPTISTVVPYIVVLPDDKKTYGDILAGVLYEVGMVYLFLADGTLSIVNAVNTGAISTAYTFLAQTGGGDIRGELQLSKKAERYDDIRVKYNSVALKTNICLFEDRSGATGAADANITVKANGDAQGGDYYPANSGTVEVFSDWKSPDGYTILAATSCALDVALGAGIALSRSLTNYYRRASFAYHNGSAFDALITRLRLVGDAYVITAQNVARYASAGAKLLLEYQAQYIADTTSAQALALILRQYYANSDIVLEIKSKQDAPVGAYVLVQDTIYSGISINARIIIKVDTGSPRTGENAFEYTLEAVADYATVSLILEGHAVTVPTNVADQVNLIADDGKITPQEKNPLKTMWLSINGDGSTSGSYWATRAAAIAAGVPTDALDAARSTLNNQLNGSPGVLLASTWEANVTVSQVDFNAAWMGYYAAESQMLATISRYSAYGTVGILDGGAYDDPTPADAPELDGGVYVIDNNQDMSIDLDGMDYDAPGALSTIEGGDWMPVGLDPSLDFDCGTWAEPSAAFLVPALIVDCGNFSD